MWKCTDFVFTMSLVVLQSVSTTKSDIATEDHLGTFQTLHNSSDDGSTEKVNHTQIQKTEIFTTTGKVFTCDPRCNQHGQCQNGTCLCAIGWNGRHCTMEGCPNSCSSHGQCKFNTNSVWRCHCYKEWDGADCSILLEQDCNDGHDNDDDGLVDCEDPECCSSSFCKSSQLCVSSPKPIDIILRKPVLSDTATFFKRMQFLIDADGLQNINTKTFNESIFWNHFNASSPPSSKPNQAICTTSYSLSSSTMTSLNKAAILLLLVACATLFIVAEAQDRIPDCDGTCGSGGSNPQRDACCKNHGYTYFSCFNGQMFCRH